MAVFMRKHIEDLSTLLGFTWWIWVASGDSSELVPKYRSLLMQTPGLWHDAAISAPAPYPAFLPAAQAV